jgi:hypothetical protein
MEFHHDHTVHIDRSRVKVGRDGVSRFKDVRVQAKKYSRSDFVLSDERVKSTIIDIKIDPTLGSEDEAIALLKLPVLASVPEIPVKRGPKAKKVKRVA